MHTVGDEVTTSGFFNVSTPETISKELFGLIPAPDDSRNSMIRENKESKQIYQHNKEITYEKQQ